jgi:hypothetical protein
MQRWDCAGCGCLVNSHSAYQLQCSVADRARRLMIRMRPWRPDRLKEKVRLALN